MSLLPKEILDLADVFGSLPNIGPKLSARISLYLSVNAKDLASKLSKTLDLVVANISSCKICGNVSNKETCDICNDDFRDSKQLLIIEDSLDLISLDSTGEYKGYYHVLGGVISPINGIGPEELNISSLLSRISKGQFSEVILALNPNLEGDSTSLYIKSVIEDINPSISITRLAKGIPVGGDIEYLSGQTLVDSMKSRVNF